jgi:hypothetical protein
MSVVVESELLTSSVIKIAPGLSETVLNELLDISAKAFSVRPLIFPKRVQEVSV